MWFGYLKGHTLVDTVNNVAISFKKVYDVAAAYFAGALTASLTGNVTGKIITPTFGKYKYQEFLKAVAAPSDTAVHAAVTLADGATTSVTTGFTNPGHYRVLKIKGNAAGIAGNVVITGTDWYGNIITDTIAANGSAAVAGVKAFKTVTSAVMPARTTAGDSISIGFVDVFGLTRPVAVAGDVLYTGKAADAVNASTFTYEAAASVDVVNQTVTRTTATTGNDDIVIEYYASQF